MGEGLDKLRAAPQPPPTLIPACHPLGLRVLHCSHMAGYPLCSGPCPTEGSSLSKGRAKCLSLSSNHRPALQASQEHSPEADLELEDSQCKSLGFAARGVYHASSYLSSHTGQIQGTARSHASNEPETSKISVVSDIRNVPVTMLLTAEFCGCCKVKHM